MPTTYNIRLMAVHPLTMGLIGQGHAGDILHDLEKFCEDHGLTPVGAQVERNDDIGELKMESQAWAHNAPEALLISIAQMFEGLLAQKMDPDSDLYDPRFVTGEPWVEIVDLAKDIVQRRREVNKS